MTERAGGLGSDRRGVVRAGVFAIRPAMPADAEFLLDMLIEAVNWAPHRNLSREQVMADPALAHYVNGWMRPGDLGVVAVGEASRLVGAAWLRYLPSGDPGYGYVRGDVPELSMGVVETWRGQGIGRKLLRAVLAAAREAGVPGVSLSVERANVAAQLYASEGFRTVESSANADTMYVDLVR